MKSSWHWLYDHVKAHDALIVAAMATIAFLARLLYKYLEFRKTALEIQKLEQEVIKLRKELAEAESGRESKVVKATFEDVEKYDPKMKQIKQQQLQREILEREKVLYAKATVRVLTDVKSSLVDTLSFIGAFGYVLYTLLRFIGQ